MVSHEISDSSTKWVLPERSPWLANLAALWTSDPTLAATLESLQGQPDTSVGYATQPSKRGPATLCRNSDDGRQLFVHSRHDPIGEAALAIDALPLADRATFCVFGFGLGYHVDELFSRAGEEAIIAVFEPDLTTLVTAFETTDLSTLIASKRVMFFAGVESKNDFFARMTPHAASISCGLERVRHAPSIAFSPDAFDQFDIWINEIEAYCRTTMATLVINGRRTAENIARNLPWYVANPGLNRLKNAYLKRPAIIVSAGPSLRKNKHLLTDAQGKAVIIAVQTTLQPLLEMNVEPQFVTSLDYHDICTRFFEKLPDTLRTELVAEPKATDAIFDMNPGPLTLLGNDFADSLIHEMKLDRPQLSSGATVANLAFYLAEHLGCDPIIFIGQDLGFSDGLCYSPGTSYEDVWRPELGRFCSLEMKQWEQIVRDRNILRRVPDHLGRPTYTEERLFTYLQHFERDFARTKSRVIDATEGGVLKRGTTVMPLREALDQFCTESFDTNPPSHDGLSWNRLDECETCLDRRREEAEEIANVSRQVLPLLQAIRERIEEQPFVNKTIGQIDALRAKMHDFAKTYQLVMQMTQATELKKFRADRRIAAARVDGTERQRRQIDRDIENVESVIAATKEFSSLLRECIERVRQFASKHNVSKSMREAA